MLEIFSGNILGKLGNLLQNPCLPLALARVAFGQYWWRKLARIGGGTSRLDDIPPRKSPLSPHKSYHGSYRLRNSPKRAFLGLFLCLGMRAPPLESALIYFFFCGNWFLRGDSWGEKFLEFALATSSVNTVICCKIRARLWHWLWWTLVKIGGGNGRGFVGEYHGSARECELFREIWSIFWIILKKWSSGTRFFGLIEEVLEKISGWYGFPRAFGSGCAVFLSEMR